MHREWPENPRVSGAKSGVGAQARKVSGFRSMGPVVLGSWLQAGITRVL